MDEVAFVIEVLLKLTKGYLVQYLINGNIKLYLFSILSVHYELQMVPT